jgi:3-isopropylmalate/(R)-2-methylmalate dehydratase large subunit
VIDGATIAPTVTWGINPGQSVPVDGRLPEPAAAAADRVGLTEALEFMGLSAGQPIAGQKIDVAFIGSCTNGRLSDLREGRARGSRPARSAERARDGRAGSQAVRIAAEREGLDAVFRDAGFDWRAAGCSMCLAMNPIG